MKKLVTVTLVILFVLGLMAGTVSAFRTAPYWNISGDWLLDFAGGTENREFVDLMQDKYGDVEGHFWWEKNPGDWEYGGTLVGYVSGHSLYLFYDRTPINYTGVFEGTIDQYGMSGTFEASSSFTSTWSTTGSPISLYKDAPAIAVQLLRDAGISHRYGDRKSGGNLIADVAHEMGPGSDFRGVSKYDKCAYRYEIAMFLNERLEVLGIDDRVEVPELGVIDSVASGATFVDNGNRTGTMTVTVLDKCGNGIEGFSTNDISIVPYTSGTEATLTQLHNYGNWSVTLIEVGNGVYTVNLNFSGSIPYNSFWDIKVNGQIITDLLKITITG